MSIKSVRAGHCETILFAKVIKLMQELDKRMEYPNCESYADEKRLTRHIEDEFYTLMEDNDPNN